MELLAKYWAMTELIDDNIGCLIKTLDENGQRENTLVDPELSEYFFEQSFDIYVNS